MTTLILSGCYDLGLVGRVDAGASGGDTDGDADGGVNVDPGENGWECEDADECLHGNCTNYVCCNDGEICCNEDGHCLNDHACDMGVFECFEDCTVGGTGEFDYMCAGGFHCDLFGCLADIQQGPCDEPGDCVSGECPSGYCCEHAGLCCATDESCPDMFDGCATDNSQTCVFTTFKLPDTGQTRCYDVSGAEVDCSSITANLDLHGQDGHHSRQAKSYTDRGDGAITDNVTGLVWAHESSTPLSWKNAETYCNTLETAGLDWRMPRRHELQTLVDYGAATKVLIDTNVFDGPEDTAPYWTGTEFAGSPTTVAWIINFQTGAVERLGKVDSAPRVRCVAEEVGEK